MQSRSHMTIGPRITTMQGRSTSGFHRPGRPRVHQAQRCSAGCTKGELHPLRTTRQADFGAGRNGGGTFSGAEMVSSTALFPSTLFKNVGVVVG